MSEFTQHTWFKLPPTRWEADGSQQRMCRLLLARRYTNEEATAITQAFKEGGRVTLTDDQTRAILLDVALGTFEFDIPF